MIGEKLYLRVIHVTLHMVKTIFRYSSYKRIYGVLKCHIYNGDLQLLMYFFLNVL